MQNSLRVHIDSHFLIPRFCTPSTKVAKNESKKDLLASFFYQARVFIENMGTAFDEIDNMTFLSVRMAIRQIG